MAKILTMEQVDIDSIKPFTGNARVGDVDSIRTSLRVLDQYRPVVVWNETREILAGNHTWKAAKANGRKRIWVQWVECKNREEAKKINLVDNRSPELGTYDIPALVDMLGSLPDMEGTGWGQSDYDRMLMELGVSDPEPDPDPGDIPDDDYESQLGVIVMCKDQVQQQFVYSTLQSIVAGKDEFKGTELKIVAV